jgi:uncharacterized protein YkwD
MTRTVAVVMACVVLAACSNALPEQDASGSAEQLGDVEASAAALSLTPINETFSSGLGSWTVGSSWTTTSTLASPSTYPAGQSNAPVGRVGTCSGRCSLTSGAVDLSGATAATLEVWSAIVGSSSLDSAGVRVYSRGAWTTVISFTASTANRNWTRRSYNLSAYLGRTDVQIAPYGSSLESGEYAQFDDVKLTVTVPDSCNVVTSCVSGDGCCPMACTSTTDNDCAGSGGIDCRNPATWPAAWTALEDSVLSLVNQRRAAGATCGGTAYPAVVAVVNNADLREAARCHSLDMANHNFFAHNSQDGTTPWTRFATAGYAGRSPLGENIAAGYTTAESVMTGWMASTGHCTNIMGSGFRQLGVGYAFDTTSTYDHYWTQDFGGAP